MRELASRVALVTGGASGIGAATARALAAGGASVVIADRDHTAAKDLAASLEGAGAEVWALPLDVADPMACDEAVAAVMARHERLDILIHSAGIGVERSFLDTTPEEWRRLVDIDLSGTFYCCKAAASAMVARRYGRIVVLASTAGVRGGTGRAAYGAAKGGVIALTKVMAVELARFGITANALAPGAIETDLVRRMHDAETRRAYRSGIPADRYGTPEEVAAAAVFLASESASYVNGHVLAVDGGFLAAGVIKRLPHSGVA